MNAKPEFSYIGRAWCGCVHAIGWDGGDKTTANWVRDMILNGLTVEHVEADLGHYEFKHGLNCDHGPRPKEKKVTRQPDLFEDNAS